MKLEQQQIAIAQACGYKLLESRHGLGQKWKHQRGHITFTIPPYLFDLNAMHEAENSLPSSLWGTYETRLREVCRIPERENNTVAKPYFCRATAAQRAEAFLKTLNLWKQEP